MELLDVAIVGIVLSGAVQLIKKYFGTSSIKTKVITVGLSILVGAIIYFFQGTAVWQSALGVLAAASTVYALLIK